MAIEQSESCVATEAAEIDRRASAHIDTIRGRDIEADTGLLPSAKALRDRADHLAQRCLSRIPYGVFADNDNGRGDRGAADTRPRYDYRRVVRRMIVR